MNEKEFIDGLRDEMMEVETENDLLAFLKRTELTLIKTQVIEEIKN